jgi:hypothetical protein
MARGRSPFSTANLAENMMHFGERPDDFVSLLQNLAGLRRRDAGEGCRHVEQIAFVERRHELRAEVLVGEDFPDFFRKRFEFELSRDADPLFPLTPALSLGERERRIPCWDRSRRFGLFNG